MKLTKKLSFSLNVLFIESFYPVVLRKIILKNGYSSDFNVVIKIKLLINTNYWDLYDR
jgi:hypothetical protein